MAMFCHAINAQHEHHQNTQHTHDQMDHSMHQSHKHTSSLEAPVSVMGSHMHEKGSWMVSYRYMAMNMEDLLQGSDAISNQEVYGLGYMVTPLKMDMNMHMVGVMYAPTEKLTLMSMINIVENDMDMQMKNMMSGMLMPFATSSSGFGDIKIAGLYSLFNKEKSRLHGQFGISIPTGSIDNKDTTPMSGANEMILPYPMQIGSGTVDSEVGLTYAGLCNSFSWGHQLKGVLRFGENSNDYRLGNQYTLDNWIAVKTFDWMSFSGRIEGAIIDKISGANPDLMPMMVTTANTENSGGTFLNAGLGLNTYVLKGAFKDLQLGAEYELPLYQDVNGVQLKQQEVVTLGLLYSF